MIIALVAGAFGVGYGYTYYTHDRHINNIEVVVSADKDKCPDDEFPVFVLIFNHSEKTIEKVYFTVKARKKGRSSDLTGSHHLTDDRIREPKKNEAFGQCWRIPLQADAKDNPRDLDWSINYIEYVFQK